LSRDTDDLDGVDHAIPARDDSEPFDSLRRDGLADDIQARRLPKRRGAKFGLKKKNQGGKKIKLRGNDEGQGEGADGSNEGSDGSNEGSDGSNEGSDGSNEGSDGSNEGSDGSDGSNEGSDGSNEGSQQISGPS
jgi:hypothetical protein